MKPKQLLTNFQTEEKVQEKPVKQPKPIETAEKPEMVKKDTVKPTDLVKKDTETPADLVKKPDVKQGSPREAIAELGKEDEPKPYKTIGEKEHYIHPYTDIFSGKTKFDIRSRKKGEDFGLGSRAGYEFDTEDEARATIDDWERNAQPQQAQSVERKTQKELAPKNLRLGSLGKIKQGSPYEVTNSLGREEPKEEPIPSKPAEMQEKSPESSLYSYFKDPSFKKAGYGNHVYENDSGEEYWVGTEEEAYEAAADDIRDFIKDSGIEGFTQNFQDWIAQNALDENWLSQLQDEEIEYYENDGDTETAEYLRGLDLYDFKNWIEGNLGREFYDIAREQGAFDIDKIVDEAISWDGIAHFLAHYDGDEIELPNGLFAYRQN